MPFKKGLLIAIEDNGKEFSYHEKMTEVLEE
jgi:hypothetical protein